MKIKEMFSLGNIIVLIIGILCGSLYYNLYLEPRDRARDSIITCVQGDRSYDAYEECVQKTRR